MSASIEIPGRSSVHNSEPDFFVISESPVIQLSEGDVLDGLEVQMESIAVQSISLNDDIERLTRQNEQLKETALSDGQAMKKHLQLCTEYKEHMVKCHERDTAMLEEARQATLKLQRENLTLTTVLEKVQRQLEDAVMSEHSLKRSKIALESQLDVALADLEDCRKMAEEARQKAEEASFVRVENGSTLVEEQLKAEMAMLKAKYEHESKLRIGDAFGVAVDEVENERERHQETKLLELQAELAIKNDELRTMKETIAKLNPESLAKESTDEQNSDAVREVLLQESCKGMQAIMEELDRKTTLLKEKTAALAQAELDNDSLREKIRALMEDNRKFEEQVKSSEERNSQLTEKHLAGLRLLQSEHSSQIEAFKLALDSERSLREKAENDYSNLLQTWQSFERGSRQPSEINNEHSASHNTSIEDAARAVAVADRLRLEADDRLLRETSAKHQAEYVWVPESSQSASGQRASASRRNSELKCPICMERFDDQIALIIHAGSCDNAPTS